MEKSIKDIERALQEQREQFLSMNNVPYFLGTGIDAFEKARRLQKEDRDKTAQILIDLGDMISPYTSDDKRSEITKRLEENISTLTANRERAAPVSDIFYDLAFFLPGIEFIARKIHQP
jgi:hypothetical protein